MVKLNLIERGFTNHSMRSIREMFKDKKGIFGLNAIQQFFVVILGIALLAYVIVIIMGTLQSANIVATGTLAANQTNNILANVSSGVTSFFGAINPVYAILAVLVIILVLVVLVRVVSAPTSAGSPQL
jgi:quinol-cytochrome oxidoreductase complex cytochrome b subunit